MNENLASRRKMPKNCEYFNQSSPQKILRKYFCFQTHQESRQLTPRTKLTSWTRTRTPTNKHGAKLFSAKRRRFFFLFSFFSPLFPSFRSGIAKIRNCGAKGEKCHRTNETRLFLIYHSFITSLLNRKTPNARTNERKSEKRKGGGSERRKWQE